MLAVGSLLQEVHKNPPQGTAAPLSHVWGCFNENIFEKGHRRTPQEEAPTEGMRKQGQGKKRKSREDALPWSITAKGIVAHEGPTPQPRETKTESSRGTDTH